MQDNFPYCILLQSLLLVWSILSPITALADNEEIELEPIVITSDYSILPETYTGYISIIDKHASDTLVGEALDYQVGVDLSHRGFLGVQEDLTIRGSTPEQVGLAINGVRIDNPQTAHHDLDLSIPSINIKNIEVVRGPSPMLWSSGVMGGAVNIVTKKPLKDEYEVSLGYGTDETRQTLVRAAKNAGKIGADLSIEETASNGWRHDTDFRKLSLASSVLLKMSDDITSDFLISYGEKEFGAADFYANYDSKEWTNNTLLMWDAAVRLDNITLIPKLYYRKHHDKYILDINREEFYINHHRTTTEGAMLEAYLDLEESGRFFAGADIDNEKIKSTRLGKDLRVRRSFFAGLKNYTLEVVGYDLLLRIDEYSDYDTELLPHAGVFFKIHDNIRLRASVSKASRPPTYTELFYDSSTSKGNQFLSPEQSTNYEAGCDIIDLYDERVKIGATIFRRDSQDLIDWVKPNASQTYYQAENITELKTEGFEIEASILPFDWLNLTGSYTYIDSDIIRGTNYISRYALNNPDHKVTSQAELNLPFGKQSFGLLYKDRKGTSHYLILNCDLTYEIGKDKRLFVKVSNLTNSTYEEIKDSPMPGREMLGGVRVSF